MTRTFYPHGICSPRFEVTVENGKITYVVFDVGCPGNSKGLNALLHGMDIDEAISRLDGITCKEKPTSCPDQLAQALKTMRDEIKEQAASE